MNQNDQQLAAEKEFLIKESARRKDIEDFREKARLKLAKRDTTVTSELIYSLMDKEFQEYLGEKC